MPASDANTRIPALPLKKFKERFRRSKGDPNEVRIRRRMALTELIYKRLAVLKILLFAVGYIWMLVIPGKELGQRTYIDENALQPGQVTTYWSWGDVHAADQYLEILENLRDTNATSGLRAAALETEFLKLGLLAATQDYSFVSNAGEINGSNAYAVLSSPRSSGTEAIVISASWLSRTGEGDGTLNLRGISTVLALAAFLRKYSLWAKDIVFLIGDGYLDGTHAWLTAYHGSPQSNLCAEPLKLSSGVIWTALNIDYPGHSFSHLGVFFEGLNGRLPNQDLLNSFQHIAYYTGGVPVLLYDHFEPHEFSHVVNLPSWIPASLRDNRDVKSFAFRARNIMRQLAYQAQGRASGVHGLFHQYRIDAFTLFAVPATGPHGFHAIGRIVESTLRTANNLLERLHASFFFYIYTTPGAPGANGQFMKIGMYLPSAILVSVAMMFSGLGCWVDAAWKLERPSKETGSTTTWIRRRRPVLQGLSIQIATNILGAALFYVMTRSWFVAGAQILLPVLFAIVLLVPLSALLVPPSASPTTAPLSTLLKALNLCLASTVISVTSLLNFPLGALLAVLMGLPLALAVPSRSLPTCMGKWIAYALLGAGYMVLAPQQTLASLLEWEVLGVWFAPFACLVYLPLVIQGGVVCLLPV